MISVVSFPLLLDHEVGATVAVLTSVRAVIANPVTMALWGLIVAGLLMIGSLPLFLGLPVVLPVWATRHGIFIARSSKRDRARRPISVRRDRTASLAADFPSSLFTRQ